MVWLVGTVTTFSCKHKYFHELSWTEGDDAHLEREFITGPNTQWVEIDYKCQSCQRKKPVTSPEEEPLLEAPDNYDDSRGLVIEYSCGHHGHGTGKEEGRNVLGVDKLGFLLIDSKEACYNCKLRESSQAHGQERTSPTPQPIGRQFTDFSQFQTDREGQILNQDPPPPVRRTSTFKKVGRKLSTKVKSFVKKTFDRKR